MVNEANKDQIECPLMGLYVHYKNKKAIEIYEEFGFTDDGFEPSEMGGEPHRKMYLVLNAYVLAAMLKEGYKKNAQRTSATMKHYRCSQAIRQLFPMILGI